MVVMLLVYHTENGMLPNTVVLIVIPCYYLVLLIYIAFIANFGSSCLIVVLNGYNTLLFFSCNI